MCAFRALGRCTQYCKFWLFYKPSVRSLFEEKIPFQIRLVGNAISPTHQTTLLPPTLSHRRVVGSFQLGKYVKTFVTEPLVYPSTIICNEFFYSKNALV